MSSPASYAWHEYRLMVRAVARGGHVYGFLCSFLSQEEAISRILDWMENNGRQFLYFEANTISDDSYDLLVTRFQPEFILE